MHSTILFIVGPTAVGKTDVAFLLAKKINAEIISCDSMQVYKGMGILTSKPQQALRKTIPHHLLSTIPVKKEYNVSRYYKDVNKKIKEIIKRGKIPLIVGGTGLYMSILIDGIFKVKAGARFKKIREKFTLEAKRRGSKKLYQKLLRIDRDAAVKIHPHDTRRIIRALEVFETTGQPISQLQKERKGLGREYDIKVFGLNMPREKLYRRIDSRVEQMFTQGLVGEVKRTLRLRLSKTVSCAIGIKELQGYFRGLYNLDEAKRLIKRNTRQYAKRQLTWFRKDKRINWIEVDGKEKSAAVANRISRQLK